MKLLDYIERNLKYKSKEKCIIYCDHEKLISEVTYENTNKIQNKIYNAIKTKIKKYSCVGLLMNHNVFLPSIVISLLKNECSFFFLDLTNQDIEIIYKLGLKWIISYQNENATSNFCTDIQLFKKMQMYENEEICIWTVENVTQELIYKDICYVMQTSGTTGKSKIVKVTHSCIASNIFSLLKTFNLFDDIIYFGTPLTFDPSMIELFLSLLSGSSLLIVHEHIKRLPHLLLKALFPEEINFHKGVTFLQMPPSVFSRWQIDDMKYIFDQSTLKHLIIGGEKFPNHILKYFDSNKNVNLYNIYGITEISCWASIYKIENKNSDISLGSPLKDTIFEVRNEDGVSISSGIGELFIGSKIRKCYIDEECVSESDDGMIFRATGDLVEKKIDQIIYMGRGNESFKRFGHRINLTHIENEISNITGLENYLVWIAEELKLISFVKLQRTDEMTKFKIIDKLKIKLLQDLPKHSLPDDIEVVSTFPLTNNGKINKKVLNNRYKNKIHSGNDNLFENPKDIFKYLLKKYLGLSTKDIDQFQQKTFLEIGGNSILAIQLLAEFKKLLNCEYPNKLLEILFEGNLSEALNFTKSLSLLKNTQVPENFAFDSSKNLLQIKWKYNLQACVDSTAIIIENKFVAIGAFSHVFAVLNIIDGNVHFTTSLPAPIESPALFSSKHNYILTGCYDGNLYCLNFTNGEHVWQYSTGDRIKCKPVFCMNGIGVLFGSYDKYIHCVNVKDGIVIWKTFIKESVASNPTYIEYLNSILICTIFGKCIMLEENTGIIKWSVNAKYPIFGSPCIFKSNNEVYIICANVNGSLYCITCTNGDVMWQFEINSQIFSSLINFENCIIFGTKDHIIYGLEPLNNQCDIKFKILLDAPIISTPCVSNNYITVATTVGSIFLIDYKLKEIITCIKLHGEIFSSPICNDNKIFIGCRDNNLYCIEIKA